MWGHMTATTANTDEVRKCGRNWRSTYITPGLKAQNIRGSLNACKIYRNCTKVTGEKSHFLYMRIQECAYTYIHSRIIHCTERKPHYFLRFIISVIIVEIATDNAVWHTSNNINRKLAPTARQSPAQRDATTSHDWWRHSVFRVREKKHSARTERRIGSESSNHDE